MIARKKTVYSDENIAYIKANYKKEMGIVGLQSIADHIGTGVPGLRRRMSELGIFAPRLKPKPGDIRIKTRFGAQSLNVCCTMMENGKQFAN